MTEEVILVR